MTCPLLPSLSELNDTVNENSDTVGQIIHYIMKNEGMDGCMFLEPIINSMIPSKLALGGWHRFLFSTPA